MPRSQYVPITRSVLRWAIEESGYTVAELAADLGIPLQTLQAWIQGPDLPRIGELQKLANKLRRQPSVFLLPEPPVSAQPVLQFRRAPGAKRLALSPVERRYIREAARIQRLVGWATSKTGVRTKALRQATIDSTPENVAQQARRDLGVDVEEQLAWHTAGMALATWRSSVEAQGILVFMFPLGPGSSRGFSIWDPLSPLVALNTHWSPEARIYTLFHELGHLLTRTNSACLESPASRDSAISDPVERWCEAFAAALLLPWSPVEHFLRTELGLTPGTRVRSIAHVARVAKRFKVSLRAAALCLVKHEVAGWDLYRALPHASDKPRGSGGSGRTRPEARVDRFGQRTIDVLVEALQRDVLSRHDVVSYLDIADSDVEALARSR